MLDMEIFGAKLREHRHKRGLTQEETAKMVGVSAQAVSKWESGECLPDCFNLKALGEVYGISLDILLESEPSGSIETAAARVEQIADEYFWSKEYRAPGSHLDLGDELWRLWKGIYFIEVGDREKQREDYERGNLRVCSDYGMKVWDDDGIACVIKSSLREKLSYGDTEVDILNILASREGLALISILDPTAPISKKELADKSGIKAAALDPLLIKLIESGVIEYVNLGLHNKEGYKLCAKCGAAAYMLLAAVHILAEKKYTLSEYFPS